MENNDQRIAAMEKLEKNSFFYEAETLLRESMESTEITPTEHRRLFNTFQKRAGTLFPDIQPDSGDAVQLRRICYILHSKEDVDEKKQTIREQLQSQIDIGDIHDASGKIKPETLWGVICVRSPELKDKYKLDDVYNNDDTDLSAAVVTTSAGLANMSDRTAHLRR